jgi:Spy/CpxP family protein refolding chaperone
MTVTGGKRTANASCASTKAPWREPRILSTLFLVFLAGAASGALSMRLGLHDRLRGAVSSSTPEASREVVLRKFQSELDLTDDQSQKLAMVLDDWGQYYQSLQEQLEDLRSTGKNRILEILNPDQRDRFEKMMKDLAPQLAQPTPVQAPIQAPIQAK